MECQLSHHLIIADVCNIHVLYAFKYEESSVLLVLVTIAAVKISQTSPPIETTMSRSIVASILHSECYILVLAS